MTLIRGTLLAPDGQPLEGKLLATSYKSPDVCYDADAENGLIEIDIPPSGDGYRFQFFPKSDGLIDALPAIDFGAKVPAKKAICFTDLCPTGKLSKDSARDLVTLIKRCKNES